MEVGLNKENEDCPFSGSERFLIRDLYPLVEGTNTRIQMQDTTGKATLVYTG